MNLRKLSREFRNCWKFSSKRGFISGFWAEWYSRELSRRVLFSWGLKQSTGKARWELRWVIRKFQRRNEIGNELIHCSIEKAYSTADFVGTRRECVKITSLNNSFQALHFTWTVTWPGMSLAGALTVVTSLWLLIRMRHIRQESVSLTIG